MKTHVRKSIILLLAMILAFAMVSPAVAQSGKEDPKPFVPKKLNTVQLGNGSYAELDYAALIPNGNGKLLSVSVKYYNGGNADLDLTNYWVKIRSKKKPGASYSVKIVPNDRNVTKVPAKDEYTITYYSQLSSDTKFSDVIVDIIQWDLYSSTGSFEKRIGEIGLTEDHFSVPQGLTHDIEYSGMKLGSYIKKSVISTNEKYYNTSITVELKNNGKATVNVPQLSFYILTSEDILYTLTANKNNLQISPRVSEEIILRGNIPVEINNKNWKLVVATTLAETNEVLPLAVYSMPETNVELGDDFSDEYSFTTLDGLYHVTMSGFARSPLDDHDILSVTLKITNKGDNPIPMPDLSGKFVLDDSIDAFATIVQPNKLIAISPGKTIEVYMYAIIPYTFEFDDLRLVLQEKTENEENTVLEVAGKNPVRPIKKLQHGSTLQIDHVGKASTYTVRDVRTYWASSSKKFVVQLDATNLERRATSPLDLLGYLKTNDGNIFPTEILEIKNRVTPGGKALIEVAALVPYNYDLQDATLILGEATVTGTGENQQIAYVNPVEIILPEENEPQDHLRDIDLYPYKLSISKVRSQIVYGSGTLVLDFDYELDKQSLVQFNGEKKKVIIEVYDEKNNVAISNTYTLENGEKNKTFEIGAHEFRFENNDDPDLLYKVERLNNNYKLNVYEELEPGFKKLLASKEIRWFATSD